MANYTCNFTIPNNSSNGGKLTGNFTPPKPTLQNGDTIQVVVTFAGTGAPGSLTGYYIISEGADALSTQNIPSPFVNGNKYLCYGSQTPTITSNSGTTTYTFPQISYGGGHSGSFELTYVVADGSSNQWSDDPEFDTGG